jgi:hypothetical protein
VHLYLDDNCVDTPALNQYLFLRQARDTPASSLWGVGVIRQHLPMAVYSDCILAVPFGLVLGPPHSRCIPHHHCRAALTGQ